MPNSAAVPDAAGIRAMLKSQYHATLAMLRDAIVKCPEDVWNTGSRGAPSWGVAYHALYFTHLYGSAGMEGFRPWPKHVADVQFEDGIAGDADPKSPLPPLRPPMSKAEVLEYWDFVDRGVDAAVDALDLAREESGFSWYPIPKLEHQIVNIRHIDHHTAQLAARIRIAADLGVAWVGARRPK